MLVTLCAKATNRQQVKVYDDPGKIGSVKFANRLESCCLARDDTQMMPPRLLVLQSNSYSFCYGHLLEGTPHCFLISICFCSGLSLLNLFSIHSQMMMTRGDGDDGKFWRFGGGIGVSSGPATMASVVQAPLSPKLPSVRLRV